MTSGPPPLRRCSVGAGRQHVAPPRPVSKQRSSQSGRTACPWPVHGTKKLTNSAEDGLRLTFPTCTAIEGPCTGQSVIAGPKKVRNYDWRARSILFKGRPRPTKNKAIRHECNETRLGHKRGCSINDCTVDNRRGNRGRSR